MLHISAVLTNMTSKVFPFEASSNETTVTRGRELSEEEASGRVVEDVKARLADKLGPVLKVMRIFGMYCGEINFNRLPSCQEPSFCGALYCSVAVVMMWALFIIETVSFFYEDISELVTLLQLVQSCLWLLICAGGSTVCLYALPVGRKKPSQFDKFLRRLLSSHDNIKFSPKNTKNLVVAASIVVVLNVFCTALITNFGDKSMVLFKPSRDWPAFRVIFPLLLTFSCGAWLYPVIFVCSICSVLADAFEDLETQVTLAIKERTVDIEKLRKEHNKLCQTVEEADKTLSPLLLATLGGHVPLLALICYKLAKFPALTSDTLALFIGNLLWCIAGIAIISTLLIHASRVNDKIHGFSKTLQQSSFSPPDTKESCELLMFLLHLQGEPLGLTVGGLVVITKSFSLTVLGALISYFTVLLSLPQSVS